MGVDRYNAAQQRSAVLDTALADGRRVNFIPHENSGNDEVLVWIDPRRIRPTDLATSGIKGRKEDFVRFLDKGKSIQAPRVHLYRGELGFTDGRHRTDVLADMGANKIAVSVPKTQVDQFRQQFGASPVTDGARRPGWSEFLDPESGTLLAPHELRHEDQAERELRLAKVRAILQRRGQEKAEVAAFGFVPR